MKCCTCTPSRQFGMFHVGIYFVHTKGCKCNTDCPCTAPSLTITTCNCSTQTPLQTIENTSPTTTEESLYTTTIKLSSVFDKKYYCAVHKNPKTRVKPLHHIAHLSKFLHLFQYLKKNLDLRSPHPGLRVSRFYCHLSFSNDLYILDPSIQGKKLLIFGMLSKVISHFVVMYFLIKRVFMFYLIYILLHCFYVEFTYFLDKHPWSGNIDRLTLHIDFTL